MRMHCMKGLFFTGKSFLTEKSCFVAACFAAVSLTALLFMECSAGTASDDTKEKLEFTVVSEDRLPDELKEIVESKKDNGFKLTYADEGYLYICMGYGRQESGGYSVTVNELYETDNAVYVNTNLLGPKAGSTPGNSPSYPYIVLKVEFRDKTVVFD